MDIRAEIIRAASQELVDAFGRLLPQLSSTAGPLDRRAPRPPGPSTTKRSTGW
ncbi:hypothetical protein ACFV1C_30540 [Streptomyces sp. NPDC059605]|uniref:hypothetical protein n=1 Tax=unclassified Streptomyces TaxID=2593676 RepID=UPI003681103A